MQLDPRTLALYTAAIGLGLAILTHLFGRVQRTYPGFDNWVLALVTFAAALCSVALRGIVPAAVVRYGPSGFGLATVFAIVAGQDRFFDAARGLRRFLVAGAAGAALTLLAEAAGRDRAGQALAAATVGALVVAAAWRFVRLAPARLAVPARFCAGVLLVLGVTRLWRAWLFLGTGLRYDVLAASTASSFNYAVNAVFVTLWSFAFTFLNAGRVAAELEESHEELRRIAVTDPLTGLLNRRAFFDEARSELSRARRYSFFVSVLMLDIDHFKQVNDRHGHDAGDRLLAAVGAVLRRELRTNDICARMGGEEFAVVLVRAGAGDAVAVAERLRQAVAATSVAGSEDRVAATASIGTVTADGAAGELDELLTRADKALYAAKQAGRNRVVAG